MKRLLAFFQTAQGTKSSTRKLGIEIETLFVDRNKRPISQTTSQNIMATLVQNGWNVVCRKNGLITSVAKQSWQLSYELGWNNFELITPAIAVEQFDWVRMMTTLNEISAIAAVHGAMSLDGFMDDDVHETTLVVPDQRDRIWINLDGLDALQMLGHIASIHYNLELCSIEEGMRWIELLNTRYFPTHINPTHDQVWRDYVRQSKAGYQDYRYGYAPKYSIEDYVKTLASIRVVMNKNDQGELVRCHPQLPFTDTHNADIDLFLRSVWWYTRLQVRGGMLVLEIRNIPRDTNKQIQNDWKNIATILGL